MTEQIEIHPLLAELDRPTTDGKPIVAEDLIERAIRLLSSPEDIREFAIRYVQRTGVHSSDFWTTIGIQTHYVTEHAGIRVDAIPHWRQVAEQQHGETAPQLIDQGIEIGRQPRRLRSQDAKVQRGEIHISEW